MNLALSDASLAQISAAQPEASTWLSANAGSGKTRVLTDRVARLLLNGVDPQNILCLTYTKAAASEMQNRLFSRLGDWAMKPDDELEAELEMLGVATHHETEFLARARRLFAQAVETPGGLRIQTIHSFCASLLRRFPREAGVPIGFTELDERSAAQLRERVADEVSQSADRHLFEDMARLLGGNDFEKFTQAIVSKKAQFQKPLSLRDAKALLGLDPEFDEDDLLYSVFLGGEEELIARLINKLEHASSNDQKAARKLKGFSGKHLEALLLLEQVFLTGEGAKSPYSAKLGQIPSGKSAEADPSLDAFRPELDALMLRLEDARPKRVALQAAKAAHTLNAFARAFLERYERSKTARGLLDFDDQILLTKQLLTDQTVAQWVLYRLDGGIDHILVDEAQDTSPEQWAVIEQLAQEITAGQGAADETNRTIFVVGDKKQSIYSFQGADASEFQRMREVFAKKLANHAEPLREKNLAFSFRSSSAILSLVDEVFQSRDEASFDPDEGHEAFHNDMPGRVDIWDPVPASDKPEDKEWFDPIDILAPSDPIVVLAEKVANQIKTMIASQVLIPTKKENGIWHARPVHEGDFLILLQRRRALFHEIIRACKKAGLEIAGADRMRINEELVVKDVKALLSFLATPEDDLSLAAALRSPLFGWTEQQLFTLAAHRGKSYLWKALRDAKDDHPETFEILSDLRKQADFLRPYELIERVLTRHGGRKRIAARLGHEAEDAVDAFVAQTLDYERSSVPSLTGFLSWLESDDPEIKRQVESAGRRIRVMTVHGSKGLEAPIVIMPETEHRKPPNLDKILPGEEYAFLNVAKPEYCDLVRQIAEKKTAALNQERERLLYVAMTRAEKWLIVAAAGKTETRPNWYDDISQAADRLGAARKAEFGVSFRRIEAGTWPTKSEDAAADQSQVPPVLEPLFSHPAPRPEIPQKAISASKLEGAKSLGGPDAQSSEDAMRYGSKVHLLLEHLPNHDKDEWTRLADRLLAPMKAEEENAQAYAEAKAVLEAEHLSHLFSQTALSEVPLSAPSAALGRRLHGIVDKLVIESDRVTVVDFKSNALVPNTPSDCPQGILAQMGAYIEALEQIYPKHQICSAIVWTRTNQFMPLPHDLVMSALKATTYLDATSPET